ncbi:MAG: STAS domain-containing protein [Vicinamibacterales bacterium]
MAESKLTIEERHAGDVTILVLTGQMLLDDGDLAFGRWIRDLVERGFVKIVVDLGAVTYIDSSGVGMLAAKLKTVKERGGDMKLVNLNPRAESLFGMLKLFIVFERLENEAAALRSFAWAAERDRRAHPQG